MKKIALFSILFSAASSLTLFGQNIDDAVRYSQTTPGGSARSQAMGSAFGAVGADFGSLGINPAGIALYRSGEFVITPSFNNSITDSRFFGETNSDNETNFNLNNLGFISSFTSKNETGWVGFNFGIGFNRTNTFNSSKFIHGINNTSSLADAFLQHANRGDFNDYYEALAFDTYVIDWDSAQNKYITDVPVAVTQQKLIQTEGRMNEWHFTFGANYNHKLYIGASFDIQSVYYKYHSIHSEFNDQNLDSYFDSFRFDEKVTTDGTGYTFKMGAIYRPVTFMRVGAALHLPTYYKFTDEYINEMNSVSYIPWEDKSKFSAKPRNVGIFDYNLTTPLKAIGSVAFQFGKVGMISADYEYVDYSKAKFKDDSHGFMDENAVIVDALRATGNIRVGGEVKLGPAALRAGYGFYGSPYKDSDAFKKNTLSAGIGFKGKSAYIDFGYVYTKYSADYSLYKLDGDLSEFTPYAGLDMSNHSMLVSVGFRF